MKNYSRNIDPLVDFKKTELIKGDIQRQNSTKNNYVYFGDELILKINDKLLQIPHTRIDKVIISMCSRLYNPGIISENIGSIFISSIKNGTFMTVPQQVLYYPDLIIFTDTNKYHIEGYDFEGIPEVIKYLIKYSVPYNDTVCLEDILENIKDDYHLSRYFDKYFPSLAKKNHLDNPRGIITINDKSKK